MKTMLIFLTIVMLGGSPFFSQAAGPSIDHIPFPEETVKQPDPLAIPSFDEQINLWIQELSNQPNFKAWKTAQWTSHPLGPGMHGWVILITNKTQELGYLIVNSTPTGKVILSEYGNGPTPLYSLARLHQSLLQQELVQADLTYAEWIVDRSWKVDRLYLQPFLALWSVRKVNDLAVTYYFDAKTGDLLSLSEQDIANLSNSFSESSTKPSSNPSSTTLTAIIPSRIISILSLPSFDPYERINWIDHPPLNIKNFTDLKMVLKEQKRLTFTARLVDEIDSIGSILIPFAVIGYHMWDKGEPYIAVDPLGLQEGMRYIPFSAFMNSGSYYVQ